MIPTLPRRLFFQPSFTTRLMLSVLLLSFVQHSQPAIGGRVYQRHTQAEIRASAEDVVSNPASSAPTAAVLSADGDLLLVGEEDHIYRSSAQTGRTAARPPGPPNTADASLSVFLDVNHASSSDDICPDAASAAQQEHAPQQKSAGIHSNLPAGVKKWEGLYGAGAPPPPLRETSDALLRTFAAIAASKNFDFAVLSSALLGWRRHPCGVVSYIPYDDDLAVLVAGDAAHSLEVLANFDRDTRTPGIFFLSEPSPLEGKHHLREKGGSCPFLLGENENDNHQGRNHTGVAATGGPAPSGGGGRRAHGADAVPSKNASETRNNSASFLRQLVLAKGTQNINFFGKCK